MSTHTVIYAYTGTLIITFSVSVNEDTEDLHVVSVHLKQSEIISYTHVLFHLIQFSFDYVVVQVNGHFISTRTVRCEYNEMNRYVCIYVHTQHWHQVAIGWTAATATMRHDMPVTIDGPS